MVVLLVYDEDWLWQGLSETTSIALFLCFYRWTTDFYLYLSSPPIWIALLLRMVYCSSLLIMRGHKVHPLWPKASPLRCLFWNNCCGMQWIASFTWIFAHFHWLLIFAVPPGQLNHIVSQAYGYSFISRLQLWRPFARGWLSVPFHCAMDLHLHSFVVTFFCPHVFCGCQMYVICSTIFFF